MLVRFATARMDADGVGVHYALGGSGPPLLLLHGYPQTHVMWHRVADGLAERFTVVIPDLRGYGDSDKPASTDDHFPYSKRAMARDQVALMRHLGFDRFDVAGHDRGGRVAHRLTLDHPDRVRRLAVLDIAPTRHMYKATDMEFAGAYYHWFFLTRPYDLPERLIGSNAEYFVRKTISTWCKTEGAIADEALREYVQCFASPEAIHATCEDYRASATIDLEHDEADLTSRIKAPVLVLWGEQGVVGRLFDVLGAWRERADDVRGWSVPGGHFVPEEAPGETLSAFFSFF